MILYRLSKNDRSFWYTKSGLLEPLELESSLMPMSNDGRNSNMLSSVKDLKAFANFFSKELINEIINDDSFIFNQVKASEVIELEHDEFIFNKNSAILTPISKDLLI